MDNPTQVDRESYNCSLSQFMCDCGLNKKVCKCICSKTNATNPGKR